MVAWGNWFTNKVSGFLDNRTSRRGFLVRSAVVGSAVATVGVKYTTRPGSAFTYITNCPPGALCRDGYTEFCCVINNGINACPSGTISGGWWRADFSVFCNGTRYYIDCNEVCCGPPRGYQTFCNACHECGCAGDCNSRKTYCTYFRYGQCNQDVQWIGPIACRMVTCVPPYQLPLGCTPDGAVDNSTADHITACLLGGGGVDNSPFFLSHLTAFSNPEEPMIILRNSDAAVGNRSDHLVILGKRGFPLSLATSDDLHAQGVPRIPLPGLVILQWARP